MMFLNLKYFSRSCDRGVRLSLFKKKDFFQRKYVQHVQGQVTKLFP